MYKELSWEQKKGLEIECDKVIFDNFNKLFDLNCRVRF